MIWAKEETLPRSEIEAIQLSKLKDTVHYIYDRVKPYREKMDAAGVRPEDIHTLEDLRKMPFTYKSDFRDNYPDGLFAVDKKEIVQLQETNAKIVTLAKRILRTETAPIVITANIMYELEN